MVLLFMILGWPVRFHLPQFEIFISFSGICIFASNANQDMQKLSDFKVCTSRVFLILIRTKSRADITPAEF